MSFANFLIRRVVLLIPTLLGVSLVTFVLVRSIPGDPVLIMLGEHATGPQHERLMHLLGLDQPLFVQYASYLSRLLTGDWGHSIFGQDAVLPLVIRRFGATLQIVALSAAFSAIVGIALGTLSAIRRGSLFDKVVRFVTLMSFSIPTFWLGLMLILLFAVTLGWLPSGGRGGMEHLLLPAAALSAWSVGIIARVTRISVLDTLSQDFVVTARAKGIGGRRVVLRHVLPNSLIPVITIIGLQFGGMLSGAVVTETVFNYPGLGQLIVSNIFARDYPTVQGAILLGAIAFAILNLVTDLAYVYLDPRVQPGRAT